MTENKDIGSLLSAKAFKTALHDVHLHHGAKMVPFCGYDMPLHYKGGILAEHEQCRTHSVIFDVSHMGQALLVSQDGEDPARTLEELVPGDICNLKPGQQRYTQLLNESGGILDDMMVTRPASLQNVDSGAPQSPQAYLYVVVNAGCKHQDFSYILEKLAGRVDVIPLEDHTMISLQGSASARVMADCLATAGKNAAGLTFMQQNMPSIDSIFPNSMPTLPKFEGTAGFCQISRAGYTGEDGYEISLPDPLAVPLFEILLAHDKVTLAGLGARDLLRLEAGFCLYGHDIDKDTTPVEAGLSWSIGKRRLREGGFPGIEKIRSQLTDGVKKKRVGLLLEGRIPAREGAEILDDRENITGTVTSGGFSPTLKKNIAMGYVPPSLADSGTQLYVRVRKKIIAAYVCTLPFVRHNVYRK